MFVNSRPEEMAVPVSAATDEQSGVGGRTDVSVGVRDLRKAFRRTGGEEVMAVDDVSLDVHSGEMVVLLGPSGCGKTTLLRCIAGLEQPNSGDVHVGGREVSGQGMRPTAPERRNIGMMFQSYALWPHMTVQQIVAYPLQARKMAKADIEPRVMEMLRVVGIESLAAQHPGQLSGGQQQRVALARSLVAGPSVMLFDEPLSNVDAKVREQLRYEIVEMQRKLGFAGIYVTHDQEEAMQLADRLAVMSAGKIVQMGPPREVYRKPATSYVARFVGALNIWQGRRTGERSDRSTVTFEVEGLGPVEVAAENAAEAVGTDVSVIVRPEALSISTTSAAACPNAWSATIVREMFVGAHSEYVLALDGGTELRCWTFDPAVSGSREGTRVSVSIDPQLLRVLAEQPADGRVTSAAPSQPVDHDLRVSS